jgi:hypothetical protein
MSDMAMLDQAMRDLSGCVPDGVLPPKLLIGSVVDVEPGQQIVIQADQGSAASSASERHDRRFRHAAGRQWSGRPLEPSPDPPSNGPVSQILTLS